MLLLTRVVWCIFVSRDRAFMYSCEVIIATFTFENQEDYKDEIGLNTFSRILK